MDCRFQLLVFFRGSTTCFLNVIPLIHSKRFQKFALLSAISKNTTVELIDPPNLDDCNPSNAKNYKHSTSGLFLLIITIFLFKITTRIREKTQKKTKILDEFPRPFLRAWARYAWPLKKPGRGWRGENLQFWRYICWKWSLYVGDHIPCHLWWPICWISRCHKTLDFWKVERFRTSKPQLFENFLIGYSRSRVIPPKKA